MRNRKERSLRSWWVPAVAVLGLVAAACGGGDSAGDGGGDAAQASDAEADFDPPSLTGAEICEMVPFEDIRAALGGDFAYAEASNVGSGCRYEVFSDETPIGGVNVKLINNGGADGLAAHVAFWAERATVSDLDPSEVGVEAHLAENSSVRNILFRSGNWVWEIGVPSGSSDEDLATAIRIAKTVFSHI